MNAGPQKAQPLEILVLPKDPSVIFGASFPSHARDRKGPEAGKALIFVFIGSNRSNLACRWTCSQVRKLSINISYRSTSVHRDTQHKYSSVPEHASPQHFLRLARKDTKPGGIANHVRDSHFKLLSPHLVLQLVVTLMLHHLAWSPVRTTGL